MLESRFQVRQPPEDLVHWVGVAGGLRFCAVGAGAGRSSNANARTLLALWLHQPLGQAHLDALQPPGRYLAYRPKKHLSFNHCQTANPNHTGHLQAARGKVRVAFSNNFVKLGDRGNRNSTICLACFMRTLPSDHGRCTLEFLRLPSRAWHKPARDSTSPLLPEGTL
jgi:hypothetical protein